MIENKMRHTLPELNQGFFDGSWFAMIYLCANEFSALIQSGSFRIIPEWESGS